MKCIVDTFTVTIVTKILSKQTIIGRSMDDDYTDTEYTLPSELAIRLTNVDNHININCGEKIIRIRVMEDVPTIQKMRPIRILYIVEHATCGYDQKFAYSKPFSAEIIASIGLIDDVTSDGFEYNELVCKMMYRNMLNNKTSNHFKVAADILLKYLDDNKCYRRLWSGLQFMNQMSEARYRKDWKFRYSVLDSMCAILARSW